VALIASYTPIDGFFHRLDPRTKLVWLGTLLVLCFSSREVPLLLGIIGVILAVSIIARLDLGTYLLASKLIAGMAVGLAVLQLAFRHEGSVILSIGGMHFYSGGLWVLLVVILRVVCMLLAFQQFLMWTRPDEISQSLVKAGIAYKYAMLVGLTLHFFPIMEQELRTVIQAQQARGLELSGPIQRTRGTINIILPFCLRALRRANEVALTMELRGYGFRRERVFSRTIKFRTADVVVTLGSMACLVAFFAARAFSISLY
jgi:energy-coupling factor transport system permease protein